MPISVGKTQSHRWSRSWDGLPFKPGYRRFKIKTVEGVDDFASMREVVDSSISAINEEDEVFPDILLIDGGKGQRSALLMRAQSRRMITRWRWAF